jgi:hypothetical protein
MLARGVLLSRSMKIYIPVSVLSVLMVSILAACSDSGSTDSSSSSSSGSGGAPAGVTCEEACSTVVTVCGGQVTQAQCLPACEKLTPSQRSCLSSSSTCDEASDPDRCDDTSASSSASTTGAGGGPPVGVPTSVTYTGSYSGEPTLTTLGNPPFYQMQATVPSAVANPAYNGTGTDFKLSLTSPALGACKLQDLSVSVKATAGNEHKLSFNIVGDVDTCGSVINAMKSSGFTATGTDLVFDGSGQLVKDVTFKISP